MNRENFEKLLQANREAKPELFNMALFVGEPNTCGTPACLLGNLALRPDLQSAFRAVPRNGGGIIGPDAMQVFSDDVQVQEYFDITQDQAIHLFDAAGCNNARTDRDKALAYVEHFMATGETPSDYDFDEDDGE